MPVRPTCCRFWESPNPKSSGKAFQGLPIEWSVIGKARHPNHRTSSFRSASSSAECDHLQREGSGESSTAAVRATSSSSPNAGFPVAASANTAADVTGAPTTATLAVSDQFQSKGAFDSYLLQITRRMVCPVVKRSHSSGGANLLELWRDQSSRR